MIRSILPALLVLVLALMLAPGASRAADALPDGVAAVVYGEKITEKEVWEAVAAQHGRTVAGRNVLQKLIVTEVIEAEVQRTDFEVDEEGLQQFVDDLVKKSGGREVVEAKLKEEGRDFEYFRRAARLAFVGGRLAARDLGLGERQPSDGQFKVWLESKMESLGVEQEPGRLRRGVVAKLRGREITAERLGRAIGEEAGRSVVENVLRKLIVVRGIERELEEAGVEVTDADVSADLRALRRDYERTNELAATVPFEQYLKAQKDLTVDELRKDPEYRARIGLRKHFATQLTDAQRRAYFEANAGRFGERRRFQFIVIQAGEAKFGGRSRTVAEAKERIDEIAQEVRDGLTWELAVQRYSEVDEKGVVSSTRATGRTGRTAAPPGVLEAVFEAKKGEIVGPVLAGFGYYLVKLIGVSPELDFEEAKPHIDKALVQAMTRRFYRGVLTDPEVQRSEAFGG